MILSLFVQIFTQSCGNFFDGHQTTVLTTEKLPPALLCSQVGLKYTRDNQSARVYVQTNGTAAEAVCGFCTTSEICLEPPTEWHREGREREGGLGILKKRTYNSHNSLHNTAASGLGPGDLGVIAQENDGQFINNSVLVKRLNPP